ncbi:MAG TPA: TIGR03435 family protein [Vicinamibacterales bacterium]|nr:TIGR03435 family protein [Vicinamibacterales bacterium]
MRVATSFARGAVVAGLLAIILGEYLPTVAGAQRAAATPVVTIAGPQGIGLTIEPISPDAPRFEAASIKRDPSGLMAASNAPVTVRSNRVLASSITIRELIRNGYNLQHVPRSFIVDGPDWIDSDRYNIEAVAAKPFESQRVRNVPAPTAAAMIRALLVDRFQLKAHNEVRQKEIYELVLDRADGRLGPGLKPSTAACLGPFDLVDLDTTNRAIQPTADGKPYFCPFGYAYGPVSFMSANQMRMRDIAMFFGLIASLNMAVVDRTGLDGRYDIELRFAGDVAVTANAAPTFRDLGSTDVPTLAGAIREQLGLKLQSTRAPVEVLVIDRIERPSEN